MLESETVVVLGASNNPDRYSYKAMKMLQERGHHAIPVNPREQSVLGQPCYGTLGEVPKPIDTITIYLAPERSSPLLEEILAAQPKRIIMNPDTENEKLSTEAQKRGIAVVKACTLVMLRTNQF